MINLLAGSILFAIIRLVWDTVHPVPTRERQHYEGKLEDSGRVSWDAMTTAQKDELWTIGGDE